MATGRLTGDRLRQKAAEMPEWTVVDEHHLHRVFRFPDFQKALEFANRAGAIAEEMHHHPDLLIGWGRCEVTIWTHSEGGVTETDFTLAARISRTEI